MKKVIFAIVLLVLSGCCTPTAGPDKVVLIMWSGENPVVEAMLKGFWIEPCNRSIKILETNESSAEAVEEKIRKIDPDLIVVGGRDSLEKVKAVADIPILYTLVLTPHEIVADRPNIIGIPVMTTPEKKFETILSFLPDVKTIGLVYGDKTEVVAQIIHRIASGSGVRILSRRLEKRQDFFDALWEMEKTDLFWMLEDIDIFTTAAIKELFDYSFETKTPVFTFSDKWVERGALFSSGIDLFDTGRQCAEITQKILSGVDIQSLKPIEPDKEVLSINMSTAKALSVDFNHEMARKMRSFTGRKR